MLLIYFLTTLALNTEIKFAATECLDNNEFDYIVVGSGSSGGPVASRLSETDNVRVLLLEAGGEPLDVSNIPLISFKALNSKMDWNFSTVRQLHCCLGFKQEKVLVNRGKALGGTSSLNFMTYTRGFREDYNGWAELGNEGWSWDEVFPYLLKLEDYKGEIPNPEDVPYHRKGGPMTVEIPVFKTPMAHAFLDAAEDIGHKVIDYNAREQIGFMYPPVTTRNGSRCSTYVAYIQPAMKKNNFVVESESLVTKIIISEDKVATGIEYEKQDGENCTAKAKREVIVSAGVIGSPHLLMLSGIGPKDHLKNLGIDVVVDLPGVGQNYQDHVTMGGIEYEIESPVTYNSVRYETDEYEKEWEFNRTGPMGCPESFEGVAYFASNYSSSPTWPDIEIFFNSDNAVKIIRSLTKPLFRPFLPPDDKDAITFLPILLRPKSRGELKLRSRNPHDHPLINPRFLTHDDDKAVLAQGIQFAHKIVATKGFQRYNPKPWFFGLGTDCSDLIKRHRTKRLSDQYHYYFCIMHLLTSSGYHPSGTCKMGPWTDKMAVVNPELKVNGIKHLRVADASIMPNVVAAHTNIACIMIGEKLSDMIKKEWGDPVDPLPEFNPKKTTE